MDIQTAFIYDSNNNFQSLDYMFFLRKQTAIDELLAFNNITDYTLDQDTNIKTSIHDVNDDGWTGFGKSMMKEDEILKILKTK